MARIFHTGMALMVNFYLARKLGPQGFGVLGMASALISYFDVLATLGVPVFATRETTQSLHGRKRVAGEMAGVLLLLGMGSYILLLATIPWLGFSRSTQAVVVIYGIQLMMGPRTFIWAFSAMESLQVPALANLIGTFVRMILVFWLVHGRQSLTTVAWATALGGGVVAAIQMGVYLHRYGVDWQFKLTLTLRIIRSSLAMAASSIMVRIYGSLDTMVLVYLSTMSAVGEFTAARKLFWVLIGFVDVYSQMLLPALVHARSAGNEVVMELAARWLKALATLLMPVAVGGTLVSTSLMVALFGPAYAPSGPVMAGMVWAVVCAGFGMHFGTLLTALNGERRLARATTVGALLNLVANVALIPRFGPVAAAWVIAFTEFVVCLMAIRAVWTTQRTVGWPAVDLSVMVGTGGMALTIGIHVFTNIWLTIGIAVGIYFVIWASWRRNRQILQRGWQRLVIKP